MTFFSDFQSDTFKGKKYENCRQMFFEGCVGQEEVQFN